MPTLQAFRDAIAKLNETLPRPGLALAVSEIYDLHSQFATEFPNSKDPGVYALVAGDGVGVLRIGKAQELGFRLGAYFMWASREEGRGREKHPDYKEARYIVTVPLPINRAFEASSIEGSYFVNSEALHLPSM